VNPLTPGTEAQFKAFWKATEESKSGEPGIYWSNHPDWGTNPCCEIALRHKQFCNLTTVNFATCKGQDDLIKRVGYAAVLGTLQAGFVDMHYLGDDWEQNCKDEALLGVSLTGIGDNAYYDSYNFKEAAETVKRVNEDVSARIGINKAARTTCIKPEGTSSLVLGCASGVHGRHAPYYIRRFRFKSNESVIQHFAKCIPDLVVADKQQPDGLILELPQKSPRTSISREEKALETLERLKFFHETWVTPGHRTGVNSHNVSCTVSVRDNEWAEVGQWMWDNRAYYNGIAVLPWDGGSYTQAPFETCDEATYNRMLEKVKDVDLSEVIEEDDHTTQAENLACSGGSCSI
jgi:ribonucleoside-triphosphate reductase